MTNSPSIPHNSIMAKKQDNSPMLLAVVLVLVAITGSVVVLAAQKYNTVKELESQAEVDSAYASLLLQKNRAAAVVSE